MENKNVKTKYNQLNNFKFRKFPGFINLFHFNKILHDTQDLSHNLNSSKYFL
jgi:hypothetical protein